jgi:hypothetical protein
MNNNSKVSPLKRPWLHPEYPWRAVDKGSRFFYYKRKPEKGTVCWWGSSEFIETSPTDVNWAEQHWEYSLQSIEDWKRMRLDGKNVLERPWEEDPQVCPYRAVDRNGRTYYYEHEPWIMAEEGLFAESKSGVITDGLPIDEYWAAENWQFSMQNYQEYLNLIQTSPLETKNNIMNDARRKYFQHPMWGVLLKGKDGMLYNTNNDEVYIDDPENLETVYQYERRLFVEEAILRIIGNGDKPGLNDARVLSDLYDNLQEVLKEKP